jgi:hypothetical protein
VERAARLFRWCGTHAGPVRIHGSQGSTIEHVDAATLIREIEEALDGTLRNATIDAVLARAAPDIDSPIGRSHRDPYDALVLRTWTRLLGPERALARKRKLCEELTNPGRVLRRNAAKEAVSLWAREGDHDRALACLEHGIAHIEPRPDTPANAVWAFRRSYVSSADLRAFFPSDTSGWADPEGWFRSGAERIRSWLDTNRVDAGRARVALAVLAVRLHRLGATEPARETLEDLAARAGDEPAILLYVADVARILGDEARAREIEMRLLRTGRLHVERVPEVLARLAESDPPGALALGEEVLAWTHHPELLTLLERTALALGSEARAEAFAAIAAADRKAEEELDALMP